MVEINLLPWREYAHARAQTQLKIISAVIIFLMLSIVAVMFVRSYAAPPQLVQLPSAPDQQAEQLKKIKYVGYVQHRQRMWALISMPDGKLLMVVAGGKVGKIFQLKSLTTTELVLTPTTNALSSVKILLSLY